MSGAHTARDVFTNAVDNVFENDAGCVLTRQNSDPESDHITIAIDVHTAFLHAAILESLNSHPFLTDPSCFRHDETNTLFVHVDDGCCLDREVKF